MDKAEEALKKSFCESFNMAKLKQLNVLRKASEFCDLVLKSKDGFEIKVHRVVVSSASNYFKDLLTLPMREKFQKSISLPDITADALEKIITFIYTNEFEEEIEYIEDIIKYAAMFQLEELIEICLLTLNKAISDHTCVKYWRLGRVNLIYDLEDKCLAYIARKADHLFASSLLSDLNIEEMRSLLANNSLHLQCYEKDIFEHVWRWAKGKVPETESFPQVFLEVVDLFHFAELNQEFILTRIFFNDEFTENAELLQKIAKLTKPKGKDEVASHFIFHKSTQRRLFGLASRKMFIGLGEDSTIGIKTNLRLTFSYTAFDNKLLICGGGSSFCELYEPNVQKWEKFPSMKTKKKWHGCSYLDNKIYVCGGINSNIVEIFDLTKGEWNYGPEMLANNSRFGLTGVNGALYAIGGDNDNVQILDPRTQKWNVVYSDSPIYGYVQCVSIGTSIYCFTLDKRYIFDTRSNEFTEEIACKDFDYFCNYCELDGSIYGLGYQKDSADKYALSLIQYHLDGKQGFKNTYGLYNLTDVKPTAVVSLYY